MGLGGEVTSHRGLLGRRKRDRNQGPESNLWFRVFAKWLPYPWGVLDVGTVKVFSTSQPYHRQSPQNVSLLGIRHW